MSERARLRWRCRRGTKELDTLLSGFLERHFETLAAADRAAFEALLEQPDDLLLDWLLGRARPAREDWRRLVARIRPPGGG